MTTTPKPFPQIALAELASTRVGITLRASLDVAGDGALRVVQGKDLGDDGRLDWDRITPSNSLTLRAEQRLRIGDILIQSRGVTFRVALIDKECGDMVAASPLYVIRILTENLESAFLAYLLRDTVMQSKLRHNATGSHVPQIPRAAFDRLKIPIPPIPIQRSIVGASDALQQEQAIQAKLSDLRMSLIRTAAFGVTVASEEFL